MKKEIEKSILQKHNLSERKQTSFLPIALLVIAAIVFALSLCIGDDSTKMPIMFIAIIIGIFGLAKMFITPKVLVYDATNEILNEEELYFDSCDKNNVMQLLSTGDIKHLRVLAKENGNHPLLVEIHTGASESVILYRVYHYIPYTYEPLTEYEIYKK